MDDYQNFSDMCRKNGLGQSQYIRHYLKDPIIGKDVRWEGRFEDYHSISIHKDDVDKFSKQVLAAEKIKFPWKDQK